MAQISKNTIDESTKLQIKLSLKKNSRILQATLSQEVCTESDTYQNYEKQMKTTIEKETLSEMQYLEDTLNCKLAELEEERKLHNSHVESTQVITQEIQKFQYSINFLEAQINQYKFELEELKYQSSRFEAEYNSLIQKRKDVTEKLHEIEFRELHTKTSDSQIASIQLDIERKTLQIRQMENLILEYERLTTPLCPQSIPRQEAEKDTLEYQRLEEDISEIKKLVLSKHKNKCSKTVGKIPQQQLMEEKSQVYSTKFDSKLIEINFFIQSEKRDLEKTKKLARSNYNTLKKMKESFENNKREWRRELHNSNLSSARRQALNSIKNKLEDQGNHLNGKLLSLKEEMKENEMKMSKLLMVENKVEAYSRFKDPEIAKEAIQCYDSYVENDKYAAKDSKFETLPAKPLFELPSELPLDDFPRESSVFVPPSIRKRQKSLHNIYKNVANYQETVKKMFQRDILRIAHNENNSHDAFSEEANWIYKMKNEVSRAGKIF